MLMEKITVKVKSTVGIGQQLDQLKSLIYKGTKLQKEIDVFCDRSKIKTLPGARSTPSHAGLPASNGSPVSNNEEGHVIVPFSVQFRCGNGEKWHNGRHFHKLPIAENYRRMMLAEDKALNAIHPLTPILSARIYDRIQGRARRYQGKRAP